MPAPPKPHETREQTTVADLEITISVETKQAVAEVGKVSTQLNTMGKTATTTASPLAKLGGLIGGQFSGALGQAGNLLAGQVTPALGEMAGAVGMSASGLAAIAGPLAAALVGFVALQKGVELAAQALVYSVQQAAEAEIVLAQTEAVIRSTGGAAGVSAEQVQEYASSLEALSGISDETIIKGENLLLTFDAIGKQTFPEATKTALDLSQAFGMDMSSASIMLGKALQEPVTGLTALRRVGVSFSDSQREQIVRMAEHGRMAQAQALILAGVSRQVAGSAEAMGGTAAGQWNKLKNIIGNFGEEVGGTVLPWIRAGLASVNTVLSELVKFAEPSLKELKTAFEDLEKATKTPQMKAALEELGQALGKDFAAAAAVIVGQMAKGITEFAQLWSKHGPEVISTITKIVDVVDMAADGISKLARAMELLSAITGGVSIPGCASGVTNFRGGLAVVGERGPETLVLPRGSSVIPDGGALARGGGGSGTTYNLYNPIFQVPNQETLDGLFRKTNVMRFGA